MNPTTEKLFGRPGFSAKQLVEQTVGPLDKQVAAINNSLLDLFGFPYRSSEEVDRVFAESGEAPEGYRWQFLYRPGMRIVQFDFTHKTPGTERLDCRGPLNFDADQCQQIRLSKERLLTYPKLDIVPGAVIMYEDKELKIGQTGEHRVNVNGLIVPLSDINNMICSSGNAGFTLVRTPDVPQGVQQVHIRSSAVLMR